MTIKDASGNDSILNKDLVLDDVYLDNKRLPNGNKYTNAKTSAQVKAQLGKESILHSLSVIAFKHKINDSNSLTDFHSNPTLYYDGTLANKYRNPTGSNICEVFAPPSVKTQTGAKPVRSAFNAMIYKPGDFIFLEDYGKISNNHLITLRRFPRAVRDNLLDSAEVPTSDICRLLTYMDGETNSMKEILGFSAGMNWTDFESEIQTIQREKTGWGSGNAKFGDVINNVFGMADTTGRFATEKLAGEAATDYDPYSTHQDKYIWGPVDVVDSVHVRKRGIKFEKEFKLTFKYHVKSYGGYNTRAVFLDILGALLSMGTMKAPFWGGSIRMNGGGGYSGPLGDMNALYKGDVAGFFTSILGGIKDKLGNLFAGGGVSGLVNAVKSIGGNMAAGFLGGQLDKLGRPEMFGMHSLLQEAPTGDWHLTVGNPFAPTMMCGNLCLEDIKIDFEGPLTVDDVPSIIIAEITLKPGMVRDKFAIQRMFNFGNQRFYGGNIDFQNRKYYRQMSEHTRLVGQDKNIKTTSQLADANARDSYNKVKSLGVISDFSPNTILSDTSQNKKVDSSSKPIGNTQLGQQTGVSNSQTTNNSGFNADNVLAVYND